MRKAVTLNFLFKHLLYQKGMMKKEEKLEQHRHRNVHMTLEK